LEVLCDSWSFFLKNCQFRFLNYLTESKNHLVLIFIFFEKTSKSMNRQFQFISKPLRNRWFSWMNPKNNPRFFDVSCFWEPWLHTYRNRFFWNVWEPTSKWVYIPRLIPLIPKNRPTLVIYLGRETWYQGK
jgi:hypothetical protein